MEGNVPEEKNASRVDNFNKNPGRHFQCVSTGGISFDRMYLQCRRPLGYLRRWMQMRRSRSLGRVWRALIVQRFKQCDGSVYVELETIPWVEGYGWSSGA
jgi:hypothetical protein